MKGYELLTEFRNLTPSQQDYCIQWFMGGISMDYEGFIDSKERPNYSASVYTVKQFEDSIYKALEIKPMPQEEQRLNQCPDCKGKLVSLGDNKFTCLYCEQCEDIEVAKLQETKPEDNKMQEEKLVQFAPDQPTQKLMSNGKVASTPTFDYHLIPTIALQRIAERFTLGQKRKGDKAWNAISKNQECLQDIDWAIERINHIINHAISLRDKLSTFKPSSQEATTVESVFGDDDAAAIGWAACFLICVTDALTKQKASSQGVQHWTAKISEKIQQADQAYWVDKQDAWMTEIFNEVTQNIPTASSGEVQNILASSSKEVHKNALNTLNPERFELIEKKHSGTLTESETESLEALQAKAKTLADQIAPIDTHSVNTNCSICGTRLVQYTPFEQGCPRCNWSIRLHSSSQEESTVQEDILHAVQNTTQETISQDAYNKAVDFLTPSPQEVPEVLRRKPLDNSYNRYCKNPNCPNRVYRKSSSDYCANCVKPAVADIHGK